MRGLSKAGTGGALTPPAFHLAAVGILTLLSACGSSDNDPGPGGVTVGEARALDEAAEMLDAQRLPREAMENPTEAPSASAAPTPSAAAD